MEYYERFRSLREDHDLTQTEVAEYLGVKQNYYSMQERGKKPFQVDQIRQLCKYYNVSADYILGLAPDMDWPRGKEQSKYIRNSTKYTFLYIHMKNPFGSKCRAFRPGRIFIVIGEARASNLLHGC